MTGYTEPGPDPTPLRIELRCDPGSIGAARHAVVAYAKRHGVDCEPVGLAVSEAVTNAVVHGQRCNNEAPIRLAACVQGDGLLVSVSDEAGGIKPHPREDHLGLGLVLIAMAADSMSVQPWGPSGTRVAMRFR
jgi:anti-sigma regulatory factor (Ser/Thr protein kinase)